MNEQAIERFNLVNGLREAIHSGQLVLMFQPQIQVATGEIVAAEALVRWQHPTRGLISPSEFIPVAEETGMMVPLGEWVLRSACTAAAGWTELTHTRVAVNVSGRQLDQPDFPDRVRTILAEVGLPAGRLEIEVTESLVVSESALKALARLREMGVRTSIDDFGTGFSSLAQLTRLPVDTLKIDQSFVRGAPTTGPEAVILAAIIHMGQGLGLDVLAEGVETPEEMDSLCQLGCSLMQGYLFSKPVMRREFEQHMTAPDAPWCTAISRPEGWSPPPAVAPAEKNQNLFPTPLRPGDSTKK
jgi:EAL domain-containing protein (putative c-di-GMP-specific phosphodiesterase class I)